MAAEKTHAAPAQNKMITVVEVMSILRVSKSSAYRVMHQLNEELQKKGYITRSGRIPKSYLLERCALQ